MNVSVYCLGVFKTGPQNCADVGKGFELGKTAIHKYGNVYQIMFQLPAFSCTLHTVICLGDHTSYFLG